MGIQVGPVHQHWNYFLALEDDVGRLFRYLEPAEANFPAYSLELSRILITAASEVDVVAKLLCEKIDPESKARDIYAYRKVIAPAHPRLSTALAMLPKFGLTFVPWEQWAEDKNPFWWGAYNDVKHHRNERFSQASLQNALNAVAALYLLLLFLYRDIGVKGELQPDPLLFQPGTPFQIDRNLYGNRETLYFLEGEQLPSHG